MESSIDDFKGEIIIRNKRGNTATLRVDFKNLLRNLCFSRE